MMSPAICVSVVWSRATGLPDAVLLVTAWTFPTTRCSVLSATRFTSAARVMVPALSWPTRVLSSDMEAARPSAFR